MADNVSVTPGSGALIAADEVVDATLGTVKVQYIKIMAGALDSSVKIPGSANGLNVDGALGLFPTVGQGDVITVTLSLDTVAYADGDLMADTQVVTGALRVSGGRAMLQSITVLDEDDQGQTFDIIFLNANNTLGTENSVPSISDANARSIIAVGGPANGLRINSTDYIDLGGCKVATKTGIGMILEGSASTDLYVATVIRGVGTYTASGVRIMFGFIWD